MNNYILPLKQQITLNVTSESTMFELNMEVISNVCVKNIELNGSMYIIIEKPRTKTPTYLVI